MRILKWALLILLAVILLVLAGFTIWAYTPLGPHAGGDRCAAIRCASAGRDFAVVDLHAGRNAADHRLHLLPGRPGGPAQLCAAGARPRRAGLPGDDRAHAVQPGGVQAGGGGCRDRRAPRDHALGHRRAFAGRRDGCELRLHPSRCGAGAGAVGGLPGGQQRPGRPAAPGRLDLRHERRVGVPVRVDASRALLPADTRYVPIEGGNHAQMGWYGPQPGDGTATISREDQQQQVVAATEELLSTVGK